VSLRSPRPHPSLCIQAVGVTAVVAIAVTGMWALENAKFGGGEEEKSKKRERRKKASEVRGSGQTDRRRMRGSVCVCVNLCVHDSGREWREERGRERALLRHGIPTLNSKQDATLKLGHVPEPRTQQDLNPDP
jgi:hypothetical protein